MFEPDSYSIHRNLSVPLLQVGFLSSGKVVALDVSYYSNVGNSMDLSLSVSIHNNGQVLLYLAILLDYVLRFSPACLSRSWSELCSTWKTLTVCPTYADVDSCAAPICRPTQPSGASEGRKA